MPMLRPAAALVAALALLAAPAAAHAAPDREVIEGDRLRLVSQLDRDAARSLEPGEAIAWTVDVSATPGEPGRIAVELVGEGQLPLRAAVARCPVAWAEGTCEQGAAELRPLEDVPLGGAADDLLSMPATDTAHLRILVEPAEEGSLEGATDLRIIARGAGEEIGVGPEPPGEDPAAPLE
ncbi:hypothetical protein ACEK07_02165, partial [Alcanivoracaceae bacterium MT1]